MRKIVYNSVYDSDNCEFVAKILVNSKVLGPIPENIELKQLYTVEELRKITICNKLLSDSNLPSMSIDEINYMLKKL